MLSAQTRLWIVLAWTGLFASAQAQPVRLNLGMNEKALEQVIASKILLQIYKRAGLDAHVQALPAARSNATLLDGLLDGEVARVQTYLDKNPTLVKVTPAYYHLTTTAFARSGSGISVKTKSDLARFRVGYLRGIAHAESISKGLEKLDVIGTYEQMYKMLEHNRIDIAIDADVNGQTRAKDMGYSDIVAVGSLATLELFHILHPSQSSLAPKIGSTIDAMKKSGELERLVRQYENEAIEQGFAR